MKFLKYLCEQALKKYPTNIIQDREIYEEYKQKSNFNFNYKNCLFLIMSEKNVLIYYIEFCDYCLKLLNMKSKRRIIEKVSKDLKDSDAKINLYIKDSILKLVNDEEDDEDINIKNEEEIKNCEDQSQNMEEEI